MNETPHTKGPFRYEDWSYGQGTRTVPVVISNSANRRLCAADSDDGQDNPYTIPLAEARANARLFAKSFSMPHYCTDPECEGGKLMRELEHLTPGGSEYVGDVGRCIEAIKQSREMDRKAREVLGHKFQALRTLNEQLATALGKMLDAYAPLAEKIVQLGGEETLHSAVRAARAAIAEQLKFF